MSWLQLKATVDSSQSEALEQFLLDAGAVSVTIQDAGDQAVFQIEVGSTPLWNTTRLTGLFSEQVDINTIANTLKSLAQFNLHSSIQIEDLADKDWEREWMKDFNAIQISEKLWICPSWLTPPDSDAINVILDPGLAFGTGTHATTALCLQWLALQDLQDQTVIDYGCGSGILAIAASLLGAAKVIAVDNDPQAIIATGNNCALNQIENDKLDAYLPAQMPDMRVNFLVANILADPLEQLAPMLAALLLPQGKILLSGLLANQLKSINEVYSKFFTMSEPIARGDWIRVEGTRIS